MIYGVTVEVYVVDSLGQERLFERDIQLSFAPWPGLSLDELLDFRGDSLAIESVTWLCHLCTFRVTCDGSAFAPENFGQLWREIHEVLPRLRLVSAEESGEEIAPV